MELAAQNVASEQDTDVITDPFLALLAADSNLGLDQGDYYRLRKNPDVRAAIARLLVKPTITRHILPIDYDDSRHASIFMDAYTDIHPHFSHRTFPTTRSGQHDITVVEIFADRSLYTHVQLRLIQILGFRLLTLVEANQVLSSAFQQVSYPVMTLIDEPFAISPGQGVPGILQTRSGRTLTLCRNCDCRGQEHRLLAVDDRSFVS